MFIKQNNRDGEYLLQYLINCHYDVIELEFKQRMRAQLTPE